MSTVSQTKELLSSSVDMIRDPHVEISTDRDSNADNEVLLSVRGLKKSFHKGSVEIPVLRGVDLEVRSGEMISIVG